MSASTALAQVPQEDCDERANNTYPKILEHPAGQAARAPRLRLQIADENDGNRFSGFAGYDASVDYVVETLEAAGYNPTVQTFDYLAFEVVGPSAYSRSHRTRSLHRGCRLRADHPVRPG